MAADNKTIQTRAAADKKHTYIETGRARTELLKNNVWSENSTKTSWKKHQRREQNAEQGTLGPKII